MATTPTPAAPLSDERRADLRQLATDAEAVCPSPWLYRPHQHDDWGCLRSQVRGSDDLSFLASFRAPHYGREAEDEHRAAKTDPYAPPARFAAAADPSTVLALLDEVEALKAQDEQSQWLIVKGLEHEAELIARAAKAEADAAALRLQVEEAKAKLAEQQAQKLELVKELLKAQDGQTTDMLTPDLLLSKYNLQAAECPDCGCSISTAGEFGCSCDVLAGSPLQEGKSHE